MTFDDSELDPVHEHAAPLVLAVGRLVLGGAALEKVLLVDIITRDIHHAGTVRDELGRELSELEGRSPGKLLERLRDLGIPDELADRILEVIRGRNRVVHHLMEQPGVPLALSTGEGAEGIVAGIDQIAVNCQRVINQLVVVAFPGLEEAFGMTLVQIAEVIGSIDPASIEDPVIRQHVEAAQGIRGLLYSEPKPPPE
jgi:hypothetical protein